MGFRDENIKTIEKEFKVKLNISGEHLKVSGTVTNIKKAASLIENLLVAIRGGQLEVGKADLHYLMSNFSKPGKPGSIIDIASSSVTRSSRGKQIGPKTEGQREYVEAIKKHDIVFGIGPAGTGKPIWRWLAR